MTSVSTSAEVAKVEDDVMGDPAPWFHVDNLDEIASPALLVFPERIEANIRRMLALAGGPDRLFPHVKTHKLPEVVRLQQAHGIQQFKCATIAEAEMVAECGASQVMLAHQPVGPNVRRLLELVARFPATRFSTIADNVDSARTIAAAARARAAGIELLLDLDVGMGRTGVVPGPEAIEVYRAIADLPGVSPGGLHAYDGHILDCDADVRRSRTRAALASALKLRDELLALGLPVPRIVIGGTPRFPFHVEASGVVCSPGTCLLMDATSEDLLPDAGFQCAALVLTRVVSKPGPNRLCLDLGHKAVASEGPHPRVRLFALPDAVTVGHSEEHLVLETARAADFAVGDALLGMPRHICPTVALHAVANVVQSGRVVSQWKVVARDRMLSI